MSLLSPCGRRELAVHFWLVCYILLGRREAPKAPKKHLNSTLESFGGLHALPAFRVQRIAFTRRVPLTRSSWPRLMATDRALNIYTFARAYLTLPNDRS